MTDRASQSKKNVDQFSWASGVLLALSIPYLLELLKDVAEPAARYTWPRQLGQAALGDVDRPQMGWLIIALLTLVGSACLLAVLIFAARGDRVAAIVGGFAMLVFAFFWAREASARAEERRCVDVSYEESITCVASSTAMWRDALIWAGPAAIAGAGYFIQAARADW